MKDLDFNVGNVSDLSPIAGLINIEYLGFPNNNVSDLSPIAGLINLKTLYFWGNNISDLSPIAGLINLRTINFTGHSVSDLSPVAGLINLTSFRSWGNPISDLSPFVGLPKLERIDICGGEISDLTPLVLITGLKELYLVGNEISDISPLRGLTGLTRVNLEENNIVDISPLAALTNLTWLDLSHNEISNFSPLDGLRENIKLVWHDNPAFPTKAPKIEGPWLWVLLPDTVGDHLTDTDLLSEVSESAVTEVEIATHGATAGKSVGDNVWTSHRLPSTGQDNILDMLKREIRYGTIYGSVSLHSPREQETTMYVGGDRGVRVWLNGDLIYEDLHGRSGSNYSDFFPVTLKQGRNILLVAVHTRGNGFFGFEPGTEYTVQTPVSATLFPRHQFIRAIPLPSTSAQKMSSTWQAGNLISPSILLPLKPSM